MYTIDIDVRGTFTDGLFSQGTEVKSVKVDTTPHDLSVCFLDCLQTGADRLGFDHLGLLLAQTMVLRWSTTVTTNVLAERRGPRLGLFVSQGHEGDLYAPKGDGVAIELVGADNITGLPAGADEQTVLRLVKSLLERGVRRLCISLASSFEDAADERRLQQIIGRQYPDHFLGAVPVLLGSDICKHPDDMTRTHYALINAYVHGPLATTLFKAEDELRDKFGWKRRLLIGHQNGGVARVAKTRAVDTIESGPTMGLYASAYFARRYDRDQVIALDVGGTTVKISFLRESAPALNREPVVFGIPLKLPVPDVSSLALGGGSVARVDQGSVRLGPESVGAYPGPACYDLGGTEASFTDAALALGFLSPHHFLGGARQLNPGAARTAIQTCVADPLGCTVEQAAHRMVECAVGMVTDGIQSRLKETGQSTSTHTLFAYGGNGPLFACAVAERLGIKDAYVFDLGPVFSVLGSSLADILHVYEHAMAVRADEAGTTELNQAVAVIREEALRDMAGEELDLTKIRLSLELDVRQPSGAVVTTAFPLASDNGHFDQAALQQACGTGVAELVRLRAMYTVGGYQPGKSTAEAKTPPHLVERRAVWWSDKPTDTPIYSWEALAPGQHVAGPSVIEGDSTTYLVAPGWQLDKDEYSNGHLTRKEA